MTTWVLTVNGVGDDTAVADAARSFAKSLPVEAGVIHASVSGQSGVAGDLLDLHELDDAGLERHAERLREANQADPRPVIEAIKARRKGA